ncbi:MAG: hypothetical protein ACRD2A_08300 [Vicinamibacterales bacterium]
MQTYRFIRQALTLVWIGIALAAPARAQSIGSGLFDLLTQQTPPPEGYARDHAAAAATFATVASLLTVELSHLPTASSSGGFVYLFSPDFGTVDRASDSFGPFFSERALRNGRGHLSVGLGFQVVRFTTLQGADLTAGTFPTNTARFGGQLLPFSVDTLSLTLDQDTATAFATYGVANRLDVGVTVPLISLRFSGRRVNTFNGISTLQSEQKGLATGLGDVGANVRLRLTGSNGSGLAVGADLRVPTGREEDLLGAGKTAGRFLAIGSWEGGLFAVHANGGFGIGGVSREQFVGGAVTVAATPRLSLVGELFARRLTDLYTVADVYLPHPVVAGVETMRWLPAKTGVRTAYAATGFKLNLFGGLLLNAQVLTRLTDTGLKARFTPSVALDYSFF